MNNLYKKIYEAINTGIQKALILDQDVSMNYQHKPIDNKSNMMSYYIQNLLDDNDSEQIYHEILNYYKKTGYIYKVKNLVELSDICQIIKKYTDEIDLTWIDTTDAMLLYNPFKYEYYSFHQYNENAFKKCKFIKFGIDMQEPLYLYRLDLLPKIEASWIDDDLDTLHFSFSKRNCVKNASDLMSNGYENTYENINIKNMNLYPVINAIKNINIGYDEYKPYLPSLNELLACQRFQDIINYAFHLMGNDKDILNLNSNRWWSSTEYDKYEAWYIEKDSISGVRDKSTIYHAFPLFKKIRD